MNIKFRLHTERKIVGYEVWNYFDLCWNYYDLLGNEIEKPFHTGKDFSTPYKDKNGKEIFFGDVISLWYSRDTTGTDIVKFNQDVEFRISDGFAGVEIPFLENAEIIGNVYETPELSDSRHEA